MSDPLVSSKKYTDVRRIAVGGMGEVLLATLRGDHGLGISEGRIVLKRTLPRHPNRAHQNKMLLEEGRIGLRLLHQNLVETFAIDRSLEDPLLLMEFLGGRSMAQVLGRAKKTKEPLPVDVALQIAREVACGLHFAHTLAEDGRGLGLVHRDVSPANIFVTFDGRVKVIDFGVAKAKDSEIRTSTGILKGKIGYMSPEHAAGEDLTPATDLWSVGVFLWEMLIADRLFAGATPAVTLYEITHGTIDRPKKRRMDLPGPVDNLVMRLLDRDRHSRIKTGAELVREIDRLRFDLKGVDIGSFLTTTFAAEAKASADDVRHAATRQGRPAPRGLIDGASEVAATVISESGDLMRLAREISAEAKANPIDDDDDPATLFDANIKDFGGGLALPSEEYAFRSDEGEAATLIDDGSIRKLLAEHLLMGSNEGDASDDGSHTQDDGDDNAKNDDAKMTAILDPGSMPSIEISTFGGEESQATAAAASSPKAPAGDPLSPRTSMSAAELGTKPTGNNPKPIGNNPTTDLDKNLDRLDKDKSSSELKRNKNQSDDDKESVEGPTPQSSKPVRQRKSASTVAVALASFGGIALALGLIFSFVAHRRASSRTPQVYVYPSSTGVDVIIARVDDAPADKRSKLGAIDLRSPIARITANGPRAKQDPDAFMKLIDDAGVLSRARLPIGSKKTAAALPPSIVLLSLLALALALPSFLGMHVVIAWMVRFLLIAACCAAGFFGMTRGVLSWPGTDAYLDTGPPATVEASGLSPSAVRAPPVVDATAVP